MENGRIWTALPMQIAAGLMACVYLWSPASAQQALTPNENLVADGLPPIPASLVEDVRKYSEARTAVLVDWHPVRREVLISTRFGDAAQLHSVAMPAGARRQLTFLSRSHKRRLVSADARRLPRLLEGHRRQRVLSALSPRPRHRRRHDADRWQVAKRHAPLESSRRSHRIHLDSTQRY